MRKRICKLLILPIIIWSVFIGYGFYINYDYNQLKDFYQVLIATTIGLIVAIIVFYFLAYVKYGTTIARNNHSNDNTLDDYFASEQDRLNSCGKDISSPHNICNPANPNYIFK